MINSRSLSPAGIKKKNDPKYRTGHLCYSSDGLNDRSNGALLSSQRYRSVLQGSVNTVCRTVELLPQHEVMETAGLLSVY